MAKPTEQDVSAIANMRTYSMYLDRLRLIATSLFSWEGLDEACGVGANKFLENALYDEGKACFIKDPELGFMALKANPSDTLNVYNLPNKIEAWSNGYTKSFDFDDVVYIMNNNQLIPTVEIMLEFARRLYEIERTIDVNLIAQKTPVLIEGDTKTILTLKQVYSQYSGNTPFIFGNKQFDISNKLNVLNTGAPYLVDKLQVQKHEIFNEALTVLGIDNANTAKRERLITDEVESNNDLISYYLNCFYKTRKDACKQIKDKFGVNVDVKINNDFLHILGMAESDIMKNEESDQEEVENE